MNKALPMARSMTRGELKAFRGSGLDPVYTEDAPVSALGILKLQDQAQDWILENVYRLTDIDDVPNNILSKLASDTWEKTYGIGEKEQIAEKNS